MRPRVVPLFLVCVLAFGCRGSFELFDEGADDGASRVYRVRFEVTCDECVIRYSLGDDGGSANARRGWSHTERMVASETWASYARLSASPVTGTVYRVAIAVDGRTVAEERSESIEGVGAFGTTLRVETPIPPARGDRIIAGSGGR